ncbi:disease resistance protein RUN1-like [Diospyros lotus]|uniref:disease resistance protein RUN1-like n=1 Tax=Diospyros lotus TaxID=55363 RepID=UPI002256289D|nr:disease resistance protein RUN1-like [Diospyros lotus]
MTTTRTSSSAPRSSAYHVFLSFRGEDNRRTFVDHLYTALANAGFRTFRDDYGMERGESIKLELHRAIEDSRVSIVVFSRNYASSSWCLDELVMILEKRRREDSSHVVLPVFYHVDPSEVRKQTGDYAEALARHEERFEGEANEWKEKLKGWKEALEEAANLTGMVLQNQADGHESKFIQKIVKVVEDKLRRTVLNVSPYPIGLHSRAKRIHLWLQDEGSDVGIVAICGMGGIGKTTIAKFVYNLNFSNFEGSSFLADIREVSRQQNGLIRLQRQLLSDIVKGRKEKINNIDEGIVKIKEAVGSKRVLVILDDVDKREQLHALLGMLDWLSLGSKMIITSRHEGLLKTHECCKVRRVELLDLNESLELFSWHAFGQNHPSDDYLVESQMAVKYCRGLPLAIKTLSSSLSGKSRDVWKSHLQKLKEIPDSEILEKLKLSYDSLQDDHDKDLFLDIACFFVGMDKDSTVTILDGCDYYTLVGIENLIDRTLLTIDMHNKLVMHQLIQEMGREIVRQESPKVLGERSRLWNHKDSFHVLREKIGTKKITGLVLDMHFLKEDKSLGNSFGHLKESNSNKHKSYHFEIFSGLLKGSANKNWNEEVLEVDAFAGMSNLQLLQISDVQLHGNCKNFPKGLRWLYWSHCPLQSTPNDFPFDKLVALQMPYSSLKNVFNGTKCPVGLKILDLSHSHNLFATPDLSMLPNLERLVLENCTGLVEINESIGLLQRLIFLNLRNCQKLKKLPKTICGLKSMATLDISGCINIEELPTELGNMDSLTVLLADGTEINHYSITLEVKTWNFFVLTWPLSVRRVPKILWVSFPQSLVYLSIAKCNLFDDTFPREFGNLSSLQILNLSMNPICSLPNCVKDLRSLRVLWLKSCPSLRSLELWKNIKILHTSGSKSLEKITFGSVRRTSSVNYCRCTSLFEIEGRFKLEPLERVDAELINNLGLFDFEAMDKPPVLLLRWRSTMRTVRHLGIYEPHTFYTHLRGSNVPVKFILKNVGSSISFTVPSDVNFKIQGMSMCFVYAHSRPRAPFSWSTDPFPHIIINNATRHLKWSFCPSFFAIPGADEDFLWLSYWKFEDLLEGGDELNISIFTSQDFHVKEVGVHLVYEESQVKKSTQCASLEVAQQIHPYGKVVPGCCNGSCLKCKNYPVPAKPGSTRVIRLGIHPKKCLDCPGGGYLVRHHSRRITPFEPLDVVCKKLIHKK